MFEAGMNSLPGLREYSVSPLVGSTMRIPQWAFANAGASASESIIARSSAFEPVDRVAGLGDDSGDLHATVAAVRAIVSARTWCMHPHETWRREGYSGCGAASSGLGGAVIGRSRGGHLSCTPRSSGRL